MPFNVNKKRVNYNRIKRQKLRTKKRQNLTKTPSSVSVLPKDIGQIIDQQNNTSSLMNTDIPSLSSMGNQALMILNNGRRNSRKKPSIGTALLNKHQIQTLKSNPTGPINLSAKKIRRITKLANLLKNAKKTMENKSVNMMMMLGN